MIRRAVAAKRTIDHNFDDKRSIQSTITEIEMLENEKKTSAVFQPQIQTFFVKINPIMNNTETN